MQGGRLGVIPAVRSVDSIIEFSSSVSGLDSTAEVGEEVNAGEGVLRARVVGDFPPLRFGVSFSTTGTDAQLHWVLIKVDALLVDELEGEAGGFSDSNDK